MAIKKKRLRKGCGFGKEKSIQRIISNHFATFIIFRGEVEDVAMYEEYNKEGWKKRGGEGKERERGK